MTAKSENFWVLLDKHQSQNGVSRRPSAEGSLYSWMGLLWARIARGRASYRDLGTYTFEPGEIPLKLQEKGVGK